MEQNKKVEELAKIELTKKQINFILKCFEGIGDLPCGWDFISENANTYRVAGKIEKNLKKSLNQFKN